MLIRRFASLLLISAVPLAAQIVNNTVTVTASQSSTAQPDEAVFSVTVASGLDKSLDDAVAAVSSLGITAANLVSVGVSPPGLPPPPCVTVTSPPQCPPSNLQWNFQLVVPFSKLKDTTAALAALQKSISQNNSGLTLSFSLSGTPVSGQQAPTCNLANLVSQARAQAQDIAGAAGFKAGVVVGLTSATSNGAPLCSLTARFALGAMFGQLEPNAIIITATRTNVIQPDQVLIGLNVQSPTTAGLDDITGALTGAGIAGASFTGVYTTNIYVPTKNGQTALLWSFTLTAPLGKLSATLSQVLSAEQTISGNNSGLTLTFFVGAAQVSQQSQPCSQAALLADAQAQAKQVAAAAGVTVGAILSIGQGSSSVAALQVVQQSVSVLGGIIETNGVGYASLLTSPVYPTCSLTVQFQLM
jgi:uncharacterized protein YggE